MTDKVDIGCAHGRFQPPHFGHFEYLFASLERCNFLWIGITQFDIRAIVTVEGVAHRGLDSANPLSYWERVLLIKAVFSEAKINQDRFGFIPFPIETPEKIPDFMGKGVVCFTTIYDEWNEKKIEILNRLGFVTEVLWKRGHKQHEGAAIRKLMRDKDMQWRTSVPPVVAAYLEEWGVAKRLSDQ